MGTGGVNMVGLAAGENSVSAGVSRVSVWGNELTGGHDFFLYLLLSHYLTK